MLPLTSQSGCRVQQMAPPESAVAPLLLPAVSAPRGHLQAQPPALPLRAVMPQLAHR